VREIAPLRWHRVEEGLYEIGHDGKGFAYDNEYPRHRSFLDTFELGSRLVTNGEFMEFIEDGGYQRPELWLADGLSTRQAEHWQAPLYWQRLDGAWHTLTLGGRERVRPDEPVCHVSYYGEVVAARVAAAARGALAGNFFEGGLLRPAPAGDAPGTRGAAEDAPLQLFGDCWEWTRSAYLPYPGYRELDGALGEYNGKFMCNQHVLRGGSCATPREHFRIPYRNFFYPHQRWQFSGIRLARDV
jgi:ergothioneine biosynthesis protein EgtB